MGCVSTRGYRSPINIPSLPPIWGDPARCAARNQWRAERKRKKKAERSGREESEFITVNTNERFPVYNSLSLSALMPQSRSGKSACVQYVNVTAMYVDPPCYRQTKVKATVIMCSEKKRDYWCTTQGICCTVEHKTFDGAAIKNRRESTRVMTSHVRARNVFALSWHRSSSVGCSTSPRH